jgi:RNA polymerase sigma-32 factor
MSLPVLSDTLDTYMAEINRFPVLTKEEEHELALSYYETKDLDSAHKLVTSNLRFVVKIAYEYRNYGCSLRDLIQEGNLGLMTAVKKFNPNKGVRLITYAVWWIRSFIQDFIIRTKSLVRRNSRALKKRLFYRQATSNEPAPGIAGRAEDPYQTDLSLDTPLGGGGEATHLDSLGDLKAGQEEVLADAEENSIVKGDVKNALALLNEKEKYVIEKRVMAEEPESLNSIGESLGVTRERVRQIESAALKKLQKTLSGKHSLQLALQARN